MARTQGSYRASCASRFSAQLEGGPIGRVLLLALEQPIEEAGKEFRWRGLRASSQATFWNKAVVDACRVLIGLDTLYASGERPPAGKRAKVRREQLLSPDAVTSTNGRRVGRSFGFRDQCAK